MIPETVHMGRDFNKKKLNRGLKWWVDCMTASKQFFMDGPNSTNIDLISSEMSQLQNLHTIHMSYEPRREKTSLRDFRPGPTQTGLYSHRRWLEA